MGKHKLSEFQDTRVTAVVGKIRLLYFPLRIQNVNYATENAYREYLDLYFALSNIMMHIEKQQYCPSLREEENGAERRELTAGLMMNIFPSGTFTAL
jgi:hypothetical protein